MIPMPLSLQGWDSHIKTIGVLAGNFEKNPSEVPRSFFMGVA